jgi:hypothetical protein
METSNLTSSFELQERIQNCILGSVLSIGRLGLVSSMPISSGGTLELFDTRAHVPKRFLSILKFFSQLRAI